MSIFRKKEKRYKFTAIGYAQMLLDIKQEKMNKINGYTSLIVILIMFVIGLLSKELMIIILANKGINKVTSLLVG